MTALGRPTAVLFDWDSTLVDNWGAIAKAMDRERYIKQAQFGRAIPAFGTINPAMGFYFDKSLPDKSNQKFDLDEAKKLLADAGFPNGEGIPKLKIIHTPSTRRDVLVIKNILKRNLNIDIELDTKDFPVLIDQFDKMDWDLCRLGSGGDFDPDDGVVDWMQTASKFNGRRRDKDKFPFGFFSDKEVDRLIDEQRTTADLEKRRELVRKADQLTSDKVACAFIYHPMDVLVHRKEVAFPAESRIPGLVDMDRVTVS